MERAEGWGASGETWVISRDGVYMYTWLYIYIYIYIYYIRRDNTYVQSVLCDVLLLDVFAKLGPDGLVLQTW